MSDSAHVVQKVDWYQFRQADGRAFLVMVASLPNGFFTAVPYEVPMRHADHGCMALGGSPEEALGQLQETLSGKSYEEIFPTPE